MERVWLVWRAPGKGGRLIANAQHGRVFQPIAQNIADFTIIHAGGDGGYQDSIYPGLGQMVKCLLLDRPQVAPAQRLIG